MTDMKPPDATPPKTKSAYVKRLSVEEIKKLPARDKAAYVKNLSSDDLMRLWSDTVRKGAKKKKPLPPHIKVTGFSGFQQMALIGDWKLKFESDLKFRGATPHHIYSLNNSNVGVSISEPAFAVNKGSLFEKLSKKVGPIDPLDKEFREYSTYVNLSPRFKVEKVEARFFGGNSMISVEGFETDTGDRVLFNFLAGSGEINYFGPPGEYEKHLPLFLESLETME